MSDAATSIEVPPEILKQMRPGEMPAWTGRPPQQIFRRKHGFSIPVGIAMAVLGWFALNSTWPLTIRGSPIHPFVFGIAMLIGVYVACVGPFLDAYIRRKTWYAVTDLRAIIVERDRYVASYLLDNALEVWFRASSDGRGTIRFGIRIAKSKNTWSATPDRLHTFAQIRGAPRVYEMVQERRQRHREFADAGEAWSPPPFARRVDPERDYDSDATMPAPAPEPPPLSYAEPLRQKLKAGERTMFVARPPTTVLFRPMDWFIVPFALVWTIGVFQWECRAIRAVFPAVGGLPFIAVGLYLLVGRYVHDILERRRTWYAVTNRRCLIAIDGKIIETKSLYWNFIQGFVRQRHADGTVTLFFELSALGREDNPPQTDITAMRRPPGVYFERIADSESVESLIIANVMPGG